MENFEYSIQLNDRDWAEFYLASEECSLTQPALATADDEQLLSDLEEAEAEENRSIQVGVGPILAHDTASCLSHGRPLAEEVLSGSKDESNLGSVSRFLCSDNQGGTASPQSSQTCEGQLPCITWRPLGSQGELPGAATERESEAVFAAKEEEESEGGDRPINPNCLLSVVVATALQGKHLPENSPGQETAERPGCALRRNLDATEAMDSPVGENQSAPLCLELQHPKDDISQAASLDTQFPTSAGSTAVSENPEVSRDLAAYPISVRFSSPISSEPGGAEHPEKGAKPLQTILMMQMQATPFQEKSPLFHGHSAPVLRDLTTSDPLSEGHGESTPRKVSQHATNLKDERGAGHHKDISCDILTEGGLAGQLGSSPSDNVVQQFPGELEGNRCPRPTQATDSRCGRTSDTHREPAASAGRAKRGDSEEPHHHLGMAVPFEEETHTMLQRGQRSDFSGESIPPCLTLRDSPESNLTAVTLPEKYDYFFCDDTHEEGRKMGEGIGVSVTDQELPEMYGPEMYEYFFNEVDEDRVKEGCGDKDTALAPLLSSDHPSVPPGGLEDLDSTVADDATHISIPEVYEHFFANSAKDKRNWRAIFLSMPASEAKKAVRALTSLICRPARHFRSQPTIHGALLRRGSQGRLVLLAPSLRDESQPRPGDLRMAVMEPERPLQPVFTHRDMCLGFMAFASWAVKTSDLQAPDAWKIVLLANFGTFSAIRYFRRQVITEGQHGT